MSEQPDPQQQFKKYFIGLILFIVAVILFFVFTGRGSLAVG
jgi:hypothetical protein